MARIQDIDIPYLEFAEAAAPGTPAAGVVRVYAKTDGSLYQKDDAGTETALAGGGAGAPDTAAYLVGTANGSLSAEKVKAALYRNYDPDEYPTSGTSLVDEFDDSSLDGAWTWTTAPSGSVSESQFPGFLHIDGGTDASNTQRFLRRTYAPGAATAFSVACKVAVSIENGNFSAGAGIALLDSGDAVIYAAEMFTDGTTTGSKAFRVVTTPATWGPGGDALSGFVYLLITRDAADAYNVYFSKNGMTWIKVGGSTVSTTVAKLALSYRSDTDSNNEEAIWDFVRVFSSVTRKIGA